MFIAMRICLVVLLSALTLCAGEDAATAAPRTQEYPWMSVKTWNELHEKFLKQAKAGNVEVLFLGDSITQGWHDAVWKKNYGEMKAANFGIGGDMTQQVLWRITTGGELDGIKPRVVVLMIGTNNFGLGGHTETAVVEGIKTIIATLQQKLPDAKILLLGIFPRDEKPGTGMRKKIAAVNAEIGKFDNGKTLRYLELGPKFLDANGTLSKEIMPDFLHLSQKGYEIWAENMNPLLLEMLGKK